MYITGKLYVISLSIRALDNYSRQLFQTQGVVSSEAGSRCI